jgi:predicted ATPase/signal transduction histidine kinase
LTHVLLRRFEMTDFSKYRFSLLREAHVSLYRGTFTERDTVLIAAPTPGQTFTASLAQLKHEYALRDEVDPGWAATPVALEYCGERIALVLTDPGGTPLPSLCRFPMALPQFLSVAVSLAATIKEVHARGLVHNDISTDNFLVEPQRHRTWLTGFGFAARLNEGKSDTRSVESAPGKFSYMAPEHSRRTNRTVDARADLYSLGCVFYEMLTGTLPVIATDPMAWAHSHGVRQPPSPTEHVAGLPPQVSSIVMKLLEKAPEARYQTAAGLLTDLERCLAEWRSSATVQPFPLDVRDIHGRLRTSRRLYGREQELAAPLAAFERVAAESTVEIVLISGHSGVGKSSLVREFRNRVRSTPHLFVAGKCERVKSRVPYAGFVQVLRGLIEPILGLSEAEFGVWRTRLQGAVGANGFLLATLVPELELIIGTQTPVSPGSAHTDQERFLRVSTSFIRAFATPEHPLIIFLDDLQWLDSGTLAAIERLVTSPEASHLLLIGALRDSEIRQSHPLRKILDAAIPRVHQVELRPLTSRDLIELVSDALCCTSEHAKPLAEIVSERTGGSPFFAIQFISALAEEGLIAFDQTQMSWFWDPSQIRARGYTDNVVDLMLHKLDLLSASAKMVLKSLACLGNGTTACTLGIATGMAEEVGEMLSEALKANLVYRQGAAYFFWHDRIQEAAYATIPLNERPFVHLEIGRRLASTPSSCERREDVFEIVNQLNRGAKLITFADEREQFARLNLVAGEKAKAAAAYSLALVYLIAAADLLGQDGDRKLAYAVEFHRAECEVVTGALAEAEARLSRLSHCPLDFSLNADVTRLRAALYTALDQLDTGLKAGLDFLRQVGIDLPLRPTDADVERAYRRTRSLLGERAIEDLRELPLMRDPALQGAMDVFADMIPAALFTDANLVNLILLYMTNLSIEHGPCEASGYGYVCLIGVFGNRYNDYDSALRFSELAMHLVDAKGLTRLKARVHMCFGAGVMPWTRPIAAAQPFVKNAFRIALESGDVTFAAYCKRNLVSNLLLSGRPLGDVQQAASEGLAFAKKTGYAMVFDAVRAQVMLIHALRSSPLDVGRLDELDDESRWSEELLRCSASRPIAAFAYWTHKLQLSVLMGDLNTALEAEANAGKLLWSSGLHVEVAEFRFYGALARVAACRMANDVDRKRHLVALRTHCDELAVWTKSCSDNFADRFALVGAEIARMEGRIMDAESLYEEAIRHAHAQGFVHNEALASELAAQFYADRGFGTVAQAYFCQAKSCNFAWGAHAKIEALERRHPYLRDDGPPGNNGITTARLDQQLDIGAVVRASQALSSEILLDRLIEVLMTTALEHAGAQRCVLALCRGSRLQIQAEAVTGPTTIDVTLQQSAPDDAQVPVSLLLTVLRTKNRVVLDDAQSEGPFSNDEYVRRQHCRSVLCIPLIKQSHLVGLLYMENNLIPGAFTPSGLSILELVASQAAISLENAQLYRDLIEENHQREQAEEASRRAQAELARVVRLTTMGELVASIVHEISQPLTAIGTSAATALRWLDRQTPELLQAQQMLQRVVHDTNRADDVIRGLRAMAKKSAPEFAAFDINEASREVLQLVQHQLEDEKIDVIAELAVPRFVNGVRVQLQQVILNLVMNAVDAMREAASCPRLLFIGSGLEHNGWVRVTVEDTGKGLDPSIAERIFEPFTTTKSGGMGLGLSICRTIIEEAHGGDLSASPRSPCGTVFRFTVPVAASAD